MKTTEKEIRKLNSYNNFMDQNIKKFYNNVVNIERFLNVNGFSITKLGNISKSGFGTHNIQIQNGDKIIVNLVLKMIGKNKPYSTFEDYNSQGKSINGIKAKKKISLIIEKFKETFSNRFSIDINIFSLDNKDNVLATICVVPEISKNQKQCYYCGKELTFDEVKAPNGNYCCLEHWD